MKEKMWMKGAVRDKCEMAKSWRGFCLSSYHAASMGPLIFAALCFCLALSTLHTSTADRRHKTLYQDCAGRRRERERERVVQNRQLRFILSSITRLHVYSVENARATGFFDSSVSMNGNVDVAGTFASNHKCIEIFYDEVRC